MASLDSLPADQRAVIELVLQRGRSYDEIAQMLSIDRAGVRQRAQGAFDALGPQTRVDPIRRALITDYLLGQLPPRIAEQTRTSLARIPAERAWARVVASELTPLARDPLPEIPAPESADAPAESAQGPDAGPTGGEGPGARAGAGAPAAAATAGAAESLPADDEPGRRRSRAGRVGARPSNRLGGAVLLGLSAAVVAAVVIVLLVSGGSSKKHTSLPASVGHTTATTTATGPNQAIAQVNLFSPSSGNQAKGIAQIRTENSALYVLIYATGVPANNHNAYAVWLYNSTSNSKLVGFVSPDVGSNGQLQTAGKLPDNPANYKQLLVTLETQPHPKAPGQVVLSGSIKIP